MDMAKVVHDILKTRWVDVNVTQPAVWDYANKQATLPTAGFALKVYLVDETEPTPRGIGWTNEDLEWRVCIDVRGPDRDRMLATMGEIKRILKLHAVRIGDGTDYDLLKCGQLVPVSEFPTFYHYTVDCKLKKLAAALPT